VIDAGETAPDFGLPDHDGRALKVSDFHGQRVVVVLLPKGRDAGWLEQ
jgi:peroxiredoxin Q/BCP